MLQLLIGCAQALYICCMVAVEATGVVVLGGFLTNTIVMLTDHALCALSHVTWSACLAGLS